MKLHDVRKKSGARQARKRLGRGRASGTGKTSGRGHKGAKSRSGYKHKAVFEGGQMPLVRRIPKRGFSNYPFRLAWAEVNLSQLERFEAGSTVDPEALAGAGLVKGRYDGIVILGGGDIGGSLTVKAHRFSKSAAAKIEAAGGSVEVLARPGTEPRAAGVEAKAAPVEEPVAEQPAGEEAAEAAAVAEEALPEQAAVTEEGAAEQVAEPEEAAADDADVDDEPVGEDNQDDDEEVSG